MGLKITVEANKKIVNFLDITLDLSRDLYKPYMKPNNQLLYVNKNSNHPPSILENIPKSVNKRLTELSKNKIVFNEAKNEYQKALDEAGYDFKLKFNPQDQNQRSRKSRRRNVTYFNPPYSRNIKTNIGKEFLKFWTDVFPQATFFSLL